MSLLLKKASYEKPMNSGDSTLMMLLSLNLLLLVFFMLLNSMATRGAKHAEDVLAEVREGYEQSRVLAGQASQGETPLMAWRESAIARLNGVMGNRLELRVSPQEGNAGVIELDMPLASAFNGQGALLQPELVRNVLAAAGSESTVIWTLRLSRSEGLRASSMMASLALQGADAMFVPSQDNTLRVVVTPGSATLPSMGLNVQNVGEKAGASVRGIEPKGGVND